MEIIMAISIFLVVFTLAEFTTKDSRTIKHDDKEDL